MSTFRLAPAAAHPTAVPVPAARPGWWSRHAAALLGALGMRTPATTQALPRGRTLWMRRPRGCCVRCEAGTLWLAFDREPQDIILEAGQTYRCDSNARLSIHAMVDSRLRVE